MTRRLIRKETRGDLPLLACLATLVLALTALCAWAPAFAGGQEDRALRQRIDAAQAQAPLISLSTTPEIFNTQPPAVDMATLLGAGRALTKQLGGGAARHVALQRRRQPRLRPGVPALPTTAGTGEHQHPADGQLSAVRAGPPALRQRPRAGRPHTAGHRAPDRVVAHHRAGARCPGRQPTDARGSPRRPGRRTPRPRRSCW
ncbi:hypothetical protein ACRAWF_27740 [Streptomyces sp. L7]